MHWPGLKGVAGQDVGDEVGVARDEGGVEVDLAFPKAVDAIVLGGGVMGQHATQRAQASSSSEPIVGEPLGQRDCPEFCMSGESTTACHWARACTVRPVVAATTAQVTGLPSASRGGCSIRA